MNDNLISVRFTTVAHGFKLSATHYDRLYFYADNNYDMDVRSIPPKKWTIHKIIKDTYAKFVILKKQS